jgi:rSAM/selenodomain-associated transferase 2
MTKYPISPTLSVIVPVLNEVATVATFLQGLARQEGVTFEVILCDGGSTDGTLVAAAPLTDTFRCGLTLLAGARGRGRQLNTGAVAARGSWLLFLHADTEFPDPNALRKGIIALSERSTTNGHDRIAGRFALKFDTGGKETPFGYCFCEGKARLDRSGCVLGDQGFMLTREFFSTVGSFDESLPVAEDVEFAERVRARGEFLLFPAEILTSPRRFETEGYRERQTLNAMIMGLLFTGQHRILQALPGIYQVQDQSHTLNLEPFFREIAVMIALLPVKERLVFWYRIGAYVRSNAWQLAYALDLRRNYRRGITVGDGKTLLLAMYDRFLERLTDHPPGRLLAAVLVRVWFSLAGGWSRLREGKRKNKKRVGR